jgi:hypothetical protein
MDICINLTWLNAGNLHDKNVNIKMFEKMISLFMPNKTILVTTITIRGPASVPPLGRDCPGCNESVAA